MQFSFDYLEVTIHRVNECGLNYWFFEDKFGGRVIEYCHDNQYHIALRLLKFKIVRFCENRWV